MNPKQKALYDKVVAANGPIWIEKTLTLSQNYKIKASSGRSEANALQSMVEPVGHFRHTPGGFKRDVRLKVITYEETKRYPYDNEKIGVIVVERFLVELI